MRRILSTFLMLAALSSVAEAQPHMVAYYPSWAVYARNYHVPDIPAELVTHINYAFANITDGEIALGDSYADIDRFYPGDCWDSGCRRGSFHQLELLKQQHPDLKTLISIGGWTWSEDFSDVAFTELSRNRFARSCAAFLDQWQFDGVDIDWEYPVCCGEPGNVNRPEDKANFTLLLQALRDHLDSLEAAHERDYLLTIASHAVALDVHYELPQIADIVDWINVMTYDFHGPWSPGDDVTNFNAALFPASDDPAEEPERTQWTCAGSINEYLSRGVPPAKLCLGLAFYGRGYGGVANINNGLFQSYTGVSPSGTWELGVYDFWDLSVNYVNANGFSSHRHSDAAVPWIYNATNQVFISYDDSLSIGAKGAFIREMNLAGSLCWELSADRNAVLLTAAVRGMHCAVPEAATVICDGDHIFLRFYTPVAANYNVWNTAVRDNDGDPDGGADPDWTLSGTVFSNGGVAVFEDAVPLELFKNYVVTMICD